MLYVIFLFIVACVIAGIVMKLEPVYMVPSFILICAGLWITISYIQNERYKAKLKCLNTTNTTETDTYDTDPDLYDDEDTPDIALEMIDIESDHPKKRKHKEKKCLSQKVFDGIPIKKLHKEMGSLGDTKIFNRMKYMAMQPKWSQDIRASYNKYSLQPYVEKELQEHADRIWWNSDHLDAYM